MSAVECAATLSAPKPEGSIGKAMEAEMGRLTETDDSPVAVGTASTQSSQADVIIRKVCVHLLPKFFLLTVTSYVDRWAAAPIHCHLQMQQPWRVGFLFQSYRA